MTIQPKKEELSAETITSCASRPHTHLAKGGGRMHHRHELISTYDTTTLSTETAAYLGDLFIEQLTKVALRGLEDASRENLEDMGK